MKELLVLFANNLLPVFLIIGVGALLGNKVKIDPRSLSKLILYVFSPCLIFSLLIESHVSNIMLFRVIAFALVSVSIIGAIAWSIARLMKFERTLLSSTMLTTMFSNAGNYGLPVVLFAFGSTALGYASLFFVANISLAYTVGTVVASMSRVSFLQALTNLVRLPLIYAVAAALLAINTGFQIPLPFQRGIELLGNASIPSMLILLGLQLKTANLKGRIVPLALTSILRLIVSPTLAIIMLPLFGLTGVAAQAITLEAGMPAAVLTTMLATEFESEPGVTTAAVFITTLLSPLTLTPLLKFLGG